MGSLERGVMEVPLLGEDVKILDLARIVSISLKAIPKTYDSEMARILAIDFSRTRRGV